MDSSKKPENKNPRKGVNPLSQLLFLWVIPTLFHGARKGLTADDLTQCLKQDQSGDLGNKLEVEWKKELQKASKTQKSPRLRNALFKTFASSLVLDGFLVLMFVLVRTLLPIVLGQLLVQFQHPIAEVSSSRLLNDSNQLLHLNKSSQNSLDNNQLISNLLNEKAGSNDNVEFHNGQKMAQFFDDTVLGYSNHHIISTRDLSKQPVEQNSLDKEVSKIPVPRPSPDAKSDKEDEFSTGTLLKDSETFFQYIWSDIYWLASGVVIMSFIGCLFEHHTDLRQRMVGARMRIACCSLIYRKTLRLSKKTAGHTPAGYLVNLLSNDVGRLDYGFIYAHYVWVLPFQSFLVCYLIWREIGYAALVGVIGLLLKTVPVQTGLSRLSSILRMKVATRTDKRVGIMHEIIQGIQVIKMYAWENPFKDVVAKSRRREVNQIQWASLIRGINMCLMVITERSTLFITTWACVALGQHITADVVFSMAQYFNVLQLTAAIFYPLALSLGAEALVSIERVEEYLLMEERDEHLKGLMRSDNKHYGATESAVNIKQVTAYWDDVDKKTLDEIVLNVKPGQLGAIIGPVGAGKSSLLQLLLGELPIKSGTSAIDGTISYASQEAWLFSGTVRSNILFGEEFDKRRYHDVVKCCALTTDFEQLPNGDKTFVGERGASLSGGQRARISLARAVYKTSSIYLLDDPLSAVDAHVGKHLFDEVIGPKGCLAKQRATRLIITHQVHFLKEADFIVIIEHGKIVRQGTYTELANSNLDFAKLLEKPDVEEELDVQEVNGDVYEDDDIPYIDGVSGYQQLRRKRASSDGSSRRSLTKSISTDDVAEKDDEEQAEGTVSFRIWRKYFGAGGSVLLLMLFLFIVILSQVVTSGSDYFVNFWTQQEYLRINNEHTIFTTYECVYIYGALIIGVIIVCFLRTYMFIDICMRASKVLHNKMFARILGAQMRFFDTNPSGRILNRFSKDMGAIDELLPRAMLEALQILLVMVGILIIVSIVNPLMIAALSGAVILFALILRLYMRPSQDFKRLEGICRSPVFSHLSATLLGISTIRSRGVQLHLSKEFDSLQDVHSAVWQLTLSANTALGLWLDVVSTGFVACVTFSFVSLMDDTFSGSVGLAISQALILTGMVQYGVRQTAETMQQMTSVERVVQYTDLEQESSPDKKPPPSWPLKGQIIMNNMSLRYDPQMPAVLKNLQVNIQSGWKVGVVGRTGAGKSSLISALFRLSSIEGEIFIDNIETGTISLDSLRTNISIIPQDPVLFSATIRNNLDPFHLFNDDALWRALEDVELKSSINSLEFMVTEAGSNFSVGQRQLICLARAILRNNKVLVLDEATANVDPQTDALIQRTIRIKFNECTVLTVAHRLHTVMDSDRILVMDAGYAKEFDHPHILLQINDGMLRNMVEATGPQESESLKKIASETYINKKKTV